MSYLGSFFIFFSLIFGTAFADQIFYSPVKANSTLQVVGNTSVSTLLGTSLNFSGNATAATLKVTGNASTATLLVSGNSTIASLIVSGNATVSGTLVAGTFSPANINISGNTTTATLVTTGNSILASSVSVGKGSAAASSAALEVSSTTRAFLPPRMTTGQINAIASPVDGLLAFESNTSTLKVYANGTWASVSSSVTGVFTEAFTSADITITPNSSSAIAHGLAGTPSLCNLRLINQSGEFGYSPGDEVFQNFGILSNSGSDAFGMIIVPDATNLLIIFNQGVPSIFNGIRKDTFTAVDFTNASWKAKIRCWR